MPTSQAAINWCNHGMHGPLLGTFDTSKVFGEGAISRVYYLGDPELVGVLYPDRARMASHAATTITPEIAKAFELAKSGRLGSRLKLKTDKPVLKFKTKTIAPLQFKKPSRTLWYHTESECYVTYMTDDPILQDNNLLIELMEVTGDPDHEAAFQKQQKKKSAAPKLKFKLKEPIKLTLKLKPKLNLKLKGESPKPALKLKLKK